MIHKNDWCFKDGTQMAISLRLGTLRDSDVQGAGLIICVFVSAIALCRRLLGYVEV